MEIRARKHREDQMKIDICIYIGCCGTVTITKGMRKTVFSVLQRLCNGLIWVYVCVFCVWMCHNCTVSSPGKPQYFTGNQSSAPMMTLLSLCTNRPATRCASEAHTEAHRDTHTHTVEKDRR